MIPCGRQQCSTAVVGTRSGMPLQHCCLGLSRRSLPSSASLLLSLQQQQPQLRRDRAATWALSSTAAVTPLKSATTAAASTAAAAPSAAALATARLPAGPPSSAGPNASAATAAQDPVPQIAPRCLTIVTGASRGLGAAIARVLAALGPPLPSPPPPPAAAAAATTPLAGGSAGAVGVRPAAADASPPRPHPPGAAAASPPLGWAHHDLILLASDPARLSSFVDCELTPLLEHHHNHQQRNQRQHNYQHQQVRHGGCGSDVGAPPRAAVTTTTAASSTTPSPAAATPSPTPRPQPHPVPPVTRIRTTCFDLGDLGALGDNTARLLSPAAATADSSATATAAESASAAAGSAEARRAGAPPAATSTSPPGGCGGDPVGASGGGDGGGVGGGLLPLPPWAYSHVLLVHNAGQVGDLVPLELQGLANIRRQTDLNVTSFAALTAEVLRTFLHAPLGRAAGEAGAATATTGGAAAAAQGQPGGQQPQPQDDQPQDDQPQQRPPPHHHLQRRVVTIVNISSVSVDRPYEHFSLYGMGKAARHMLIRSVAHEATLREQEEEGAACGASTASSSSAAEAAASSAAVAPPPPQSPLPPRGGRSQVARVRALSYAPGAIDTDMQAAAREALPDGSLKARFQDNARSGRLVDPRISAQVLYDILACDTYDNGAHVDYYSAVAGGADAAHPLAGSS